MTWHYSIPEDSYPVTIYDHAGQEVAQVTSAEAPFEIPDTVLQKMEDEVMAEGLSGGLSDRQVAILRDAIFENIERGEPP